jgi:hypothetical protein
MVSHQEVAEFAFVKQELLQKQIHLSGRIAKEYTRIFTNHARILLLRKDLEELNIDILSMNVEHPHSVNTVMVKYNLWGCSRLALC